MDDAALKKEVTKIYKKLQSSNQKKRVSALESLTELVASDPRSILPLVKAIVPLLEQGSEEERYLSLITIRTIASQEEKAKLVKPFIESIKANAQYNIFDTDLNLYVPGCKIRTNALFTLFKIGKAKPRIFKKGLVEIIVTVFDPPVYTPEKDRSKELTNLYKTALSLMLLISATKPKLSSKYLGSIIKLLNDEDMSIKMEAALVVEKIAKHNPEKLEGRISNIVALLKYPTYRPDAKEGKLADLYITAVSILDDIASSDPSKLEDAAPVLCSALRDTFKYERWVEDYNEKKEGSFREIIKAVIEKTADGVPKIIAPVMAEHLKSVEDLRKYTFGLFLRIGKKNPRIAVQAIAPLLNDNNVNGRQLAVHLLGDIGENNPDVLKPYVPNIVKCFDDRYIHVRQRAVYAMGKIGGVKPEYVAQHVPQMVPLLSDSYEAVKIYSIDAIARIGGIHPKYVVPAIPSLIKLLDDKNMKVRQYSNAALKKLKIDVPTYVELIESMQRVNKRIAVASSKGSYPEELEAEFQQAKKEMQEARWEQAFELISTVSERVEEMINTAAPRIEMNVKSRAPLTAKQWEDIIIDITNRGNAHAKDLNVKFEGPIEFSGNSFIPLLESRSGAEIKVSGRLSNENGGRVKLRVVYKDFDDNEGEIEAEINYNKGDILELSHEEEWSKVEGEGKQQEGGKAKPGKEGDTAKEDTSVGGEEGDAGEGGEIKEPGGEVLKNEQGEEPDIRTITEGGKEEGVEVKEEKAVPTSEEESGKEREEKHEPEEKAEERGEEGGEQEEETPEIEEEEGVDQAEEAPAKEEEGKKWSKIGVEDTMECPHCSTTIPTDSMFCYKCGKKVKE